MMKQTLMELPLNVITPDDNYRKTLNEASMRQLTASVKKHGVQEPIIVRNRDNDGRYRVVAGQRRFLAAERAGLVTIPSIVREIADDEVLTIQIIENVQRENVPYMEEADAIRRLRDELALDASEIAKLISKSESYVFAMFRLTLMEPEAQMVCRAGKISKSVAWLVSALAPGFQDTAAGALAREKGRLITEPYARRYLENQFGAEKAKKRQRSIIKRNEAAGNWKAALLTFDAVQWDAFKIAVRGRTEIGVWAEAVDIVARESR
ncbi:MAG TPA: ParB/RepB/Spo0J family partition protein [Pyrinomonadaceae bacterium]|nr:ParB/RepB/Spo0J family partition protein [Pyrinomonadaceae bacterium]